MDRRDFLKATTVAAIVTPSIAQAAGTPKPSSEIRSTLAFESRTGTFDGVEMETTPVVRADSRCIYLVGDEGNNILAVQMAKVVQVPFVDYSRHPTWAIEERIISLFDCADICEGAETIQVPYADAVEVLIAKVHGDFGSILVNDQDADRILPHAVGRRVIVSRLIPRQFIYATATPAQTGGIFEDPKGRLAMFIRAPSVARVIVT